jgi:hypothetical protein
MEDTEKLLMYDVFECSPKAAKRIKPMPEGYITQPTSGKPSRGKYPLAAMNVGTCFLIPQDKVTSELSLRNMISRRAKRMQIKCCVIKHNAPDNCYEIARIA